MRFDSASLLNRASAVLRWRFMEGDRAAARGSLGTRCVPSGMWFDSTALRFGR